MPRAEAGTTKAIANAMKSKGLQRLRWYCQACERQMRDENGFKCHVQSEAHVRQMLVIGEDPRKAINDYSRQFQRDFIQLLRTSHGEKRVNMNHFYQEYIGNKIHTHMNATKWNSLTEFAKYLGREGICRVDEEEPGESGRGGVFIAWIDNSPESLRRQDAIRKKERQDRGDEEREQRTIRMQIARAHKDKGLASDGEGTDEEVEKARELKRQEGEKIKLNFSAKPSSVAKPPSPPLTDKEDDNLGEGPNFLSFKAPSDSTSASPPLTTSTNSSTRISNSNTPVTLEPTSQIPFKSKNVFASKSQKPNPLAGKANPLAAKRSAAPVTLQKPMSEAERIMRKEIEGKRSKKLESSGGFKRQRLT